MDPSFKYVAAFFGFAAFLLVWNRTFRWGHLVWTTWKGRRSAEQSEAQLPIVLFVHSGPWFLTAYIIAAVYILTKPHRTEWEWFFGGALLVPPVIALLVLRWYIRWKHMERSEPQ